MKDGWLPVSKRNPCPACGKPDWCLIGSRFVLCNRVESNKPQPGGGWLHPLDVSLQRPTPPVPPPRPPTPNFTAMIRRWAIETPEMALQALATSLGVSADSLASLNAVYASQHRAWAFPMRDGYGNIIGIRLRSDDGRKWAVRGSRNGIFIPQGIAPGKVAYITEGPTDTAAALSLGLYAIGRPSCNTGSHEIRQHLKSVGIYRAIIIADNDAPGLDGAARVGHELKLKHCIWCPPTKDIREYANLGGTSTLIQSDLHNRIWIVP